MVAVVLLVAVAAGGTSSTTTAAAIPTPKRVDCKTRTADVAYPLRVRGRHLVDARGRPFLMNGDSAWSLIAQLHDDDVDRYLDDRKARGFNAVLVNLIEHTYASKAPADIYGAQPFRVDGDFTTPNEAYFEHADSVIQNAAARGMLVLLAPAYFGYSGDGWYDAIVANGPQRMEQYGRYVGERYAACRNIIWVIGGDRTPKDTATGDALARGILAADPKALLTAHADSEAPVDRIWGKYEWLGVNSLFTYKGVWPRAVALYKRSAKPFFLIESAYENDGWNPQTPTRMRTQAYQAILGGATGHVFGNNPIWHFDGPGCCSSVEFPTTWENALGLEGSKSMSVLRMIFSRYPWYAMTPDTSNTFVTTGLSSGLDRVAASVANDRSFAMAFIPSARTVRLNLGRLRGPANLVWIDPSDGARRRGVSSAAGRLAIATPGVNAKGREDWLLIADTRPPSARKGSNAR
jgi:uncharacterized protein DUF4038/collagenase-like protein with putative collagen-binding domain